MLRLEYQSVRPKRAVPSVTLGLVPAVTFLLSFFVVVHNGNEEPFGVFQWSDALIQVGGPALVTGLWVWWLYVALIQEDLRPLLLLPLTAWAALNVLLVAALAAGYFCEPWNL